MYRNIMTIKNLETTSFIVLSDKKLFSSFDDYGCKTRFELIIEYLCNLGYFMEIDERKSNEGLVLKFTKDDTIIIFEETSVGSVLLHDIYSSSINKREFEFFVNFIEKPLDCLCNVDNKIFMNQFNHVKKIINNLFYV